VFNSVNFFGLCEVKILELANSIILAIKILKMIRVEDKESIIENWVIDHTLFDEVSHTIDRGTEISSTDMLTHQ